METFANPIRVLFAASECAPLVKTGGLGDVAGALPAALRAIGVDVRMLLPGYPAVVDGLAAAVEVARFGSEAALPAHRVLAATLPNGVPALVVDCPVLYARGGGPYQDASGRDWRDNAQRFGLFGRVAARLSEKAGPLDWRPDMVHAHDWQAGLAPAYLRLVSGTSIPALMTIHNLAFPGVFDPAWREALALPASSWSMHGVEYHGSLSFLKAGLYYANAITTVSPTYAREVQSKPLGMGLEGLLAARHEVLRGILNGIDTMLWDPGHDPWIAQPYDAGSLQNKATNKRALQEEFGLATHGDAPLFAIVSRLTYQKGIDIVAAIVDDLASSGAQLVVLGSGDRDSEIELNAIAQRHAGAVGVVIGFNEALAHRIEAGADAFLMPSRFEPCGMNQMYSQRYGTPPVVHATGGLVDTVVDCDARTLAAGTATGFTFDDAAPSGLKAAIARCVGAYRDPDTWRQLMRNGMARDFSWRRSATEYAKLYAELTGRGV
jgi:starch synthase